MVKKMVIKNGYGNQINRITGSGIQPVKTKVENQTGGFGAVLQEKVNQNTPLKFSKHAEDRLQDRKISLSQTQKEKIQQAVNKAEEKGVKDSLVLMDNMAFVVNVRSKTVITAVNSTELKENVFTNIDGAVFA
jgi:flagellar operon protein